MQTLRVDCSASSTVPETRVVEKKHKHNQLYYGGMRSAKDAFDTTSDYMEYGSFITAEYGQNDALLRLKRTLSSDFQTKQQKLHIQQTRNVFLKNANQLERCRKECKRRIDDNINAIAHAYPVVQRALNFKRLCRRECVHVSAHGVNPENKTLDVSLMMQRLTTLAGDVDHRDHSVDNQDTLYTVFECDSIREAQDMINETHDAYEVPAHGLLILGGTAKVWQAATRLQEVDNNYYTACLALDTTIHQCMYMAVE
jgi:hypothetical protein